MFAMAASSSVRTTLPGEPRTRELSGISRPSVTSAPAPIRQLRPIFAPLRTIAWMPMRQPSPIVAAVHHGLMADRDVGSDGQRISGIRVQHAALLHVAVLADDDGLVVAAYRCVWPDVDARVHYDVADDRGTFVNECRGVDKRDVVPKLVDAHGGSPIIGRVAGWNVRSRLDASLRGLVRRPMAGRSRKTV